ncbi:MAG: class I SAM-dependent methyltransferase [Armatimonadetes bacterium]|nr:class I SAM-dependent methyltransferase [Armatimonadota bacterium]
MEPEEYPKMRRLEDTYWWFVGRRELVRTLLDERVPRGASYLDIGCGTGAMSQELAARGTVTSLDFEHAALHFARTRGLTRLVQASAETLPFPDDAFDALTALDVIEHLDDDLAAAREIRRVLKPGGVAIVSVPAFMFLWSEHDIALHHRRRYRAGELRDLFRRAGLEVERVSYVMTSLFPAVAAVRLAQKALGSDRKTLEAAKTTLPDVPGPLNGVLTGLLRAEAQVVRRVSLPFGVSLVGVARKQKTGN